MGSLVVVETRRLRTRRVRNALVVAMHDAVRCDAEFIPLHPLPALPVPFAIAACLVLESLWSIVYAC